MSLSNIVIIIPSLDPSDKIIGLVQSLRKQCETPIVIVNDGSCKECDPIFEQLCLIENTHVLRHYVNLGKGRALKTAFNYCLTAIENLKGVVTADGDGQHLPEDILKCVHALDDNPKSLILGCRNFSMKGIPWKSSFGNNLTTGIFKYLVRLNITDTQTGLRGIPKDFMVILMNKKGERFEFETTMLLESRQKNRSFPVAEVRIETVYIDGNKTTHFRPFYDSIKIYSIILGSTFHRVFLFSISGILSAVVDQGVFALFFYVVMPIIHLPVLFFSVIFARITSLTINYLLNRNLVFKYDSRKIDIKSFALYLLLCMFIMFSSYGLLKLSFSLFPEINIVIQKILIDAILFIVSYKVQNNIIFNLGRQEPPHTLK